MPIIRIEMREGRTIEQKRELVNVLMTQTARTTGCGVESVTSLSKMCGRKTGGQAVNFAQTSILIKNLFSRSRC